MKIAIVTDTNSGISKQEAEKYGIYLIPMPVIIDDKIYYENKNISAEEFYHFLSSDKNVSTSQPSPGDIMDLWNKLLSEDKYDSIVYIPMSSGLSKSCEVAMSLARDYENKVFVVDNHRLSVTLKESVLQAKELADNGKSASEIKDILDKDGLNSVIYVTVSTLEYLKKGGRITPAVAMIGSVLNIKPILSINGNTLDSFAKARTIKKCKSIMINAIKSDIENRFSENDMSKSRIALAGSNLSTEQINEWIATVKEAFPDKEIYYDNLPASLACHTGPEAFGIGICFR